MTILTQLATARASLVAIAKGLDTFADRLMKGMGVREGDLA